jgi:hypothetical protein
MSEKSSVYSLSALPDRNERGAYTFYCDDFRQEITGKSILVGVYGAEMLVTEFPIVLPTFFVITHVWTTVSRPFGKLIFRMLLDDEVLSEEVVDVGELRKKLPPSSASLSDDPFARHGLSRVVRLSPFVIEKESTVRVRIETEDGELRTSALKIKLNPSVVAASSTSPG